MRVRQQGKMMIIIIAVVAVLAIGGGAAAFFLLGGEEPMPEEGMEGEEEVVEEIILPIIYFRIDPPIIVNIGADPAQPSYLQLVLEIALRDEMLIEGLTMHDPVLRHEIAGVVMKRETEELKSLEGRTMLQKEIVDTINAMLKREANAEGEIENVFFSTYVVQ